MNVKAVVAFVAFLFCIFVSGLFALIFCKSETFDDTESFVILGENENVVNKHGSSKSCTPFPKYWQTEQEFVENSDWQVVVGASESKRLYKEIKKMLSTKKEITTMYMPVLDMSFLTGKKPDVKAEKGIPVSDSNIFISYVVYRKKNEQIMEKLLIGGSNIIRLDEKYFEVDPKKKSRVYHIIKTEIAP